MILQNPLYLALGLVALPLLHRAYVAESFRARFTTVFYAFMILLLAGAAASPQIQEDSAQVQENRLIHLEDSSRSMTTDRPNISLEDVKVENRKIATGNSSSIKQALMAMLEENTTYLVSSDMQDKANFDEVARAYNDANSDLNFLKKSMDRERSVKIEGPSIAVPNAKNSYTIKVESTIEGKERPEVYVDGEEVDLTSTEDGYVVKQEFSSTGYHRIRAELSSEDIYSQNNEYFKSVKVIERPEVLVIGAQGTLGEKLQEYFDLSYMNSVPDDLSDYYAVIAKKQFEASSNIKNYLTEGNGLVYTGEGTNEVLPVEQHDYSQATENPRIIIGMDISLGNTQETTKQSQNLTSDFVELLTVRKPETIVGAFAYNQSAYKFGEPQPLSNKEYARSLTGLKGISTSGTAHHLNALGASKRIIGNSPGNIILISDFKMPTDGGILTPSAEERREMYEAGNLDFGQVVPEAYEYEEEFIDRAADIPSNITFHAVAVGDSNKGLLRKLRELDSQNVRAYDANEGDDLNSLINNFQGGGGSDRKSIGVVDANHFITDGLGLLRSTITEIGDVKPRPTANELIQTSNNRPFLTTWRYGLGRVAAFSGGGPDLENLMSQEPVVFSRTLNWAVGNPERKNDGSVTAESARVGEEVVLTASYPAEGFVRVSEESYRATTRPEKVGFHDYFGHQFSYNYRPEIENLGYREDVMNSLARRTGGEVFNETTLNEIEGNVKSRTVTSVETTSLTSHLLILALVLFLVQIGFRKYRGWM